MTIKSKVPIIFFWMAGFLANASGWLFALIANRALSLADMGNLSLLINSITIVSILSLSIAIATNTFGAKNRPDSQIAMAAFGRLGLTCGLVISSVFLIASPWWVSYFNYSSSFMSLAISAVILFLMFPLSWIRGVLQAKFLLVVVGVGLIIEALSKIVIASYSIDKINAFEVVIGSIAGASIITIVFYAFSSAASISTTLRSSGKLQRQHWEILLKLMVARIGVISLITVDIFFAKRYLPVDEAGIYALLSLVGKAIFFVMQSFYLLITPAIAPVLDNAQRRKRTISHVLFGAALMISCLISLYVLIPQYSIGILLGERYKLIMPYVLHYAIANGFLSLALLISLYKMLRGQFIFTILVMGALVVEIILMFSFNESIDLIARNVLIASMLLAISSIATFGILKKLNNT